MCKISVVVSVYNMEIYLERFMTSILNQCFEDYEVILVDDGSNDRSPIICDEYAERYSGKVRTLHKSNGGLSSARNAGIKIAEGNYITFPDPDDWVEGTYLSSLYGLITENKAQMSCVSYNIAYEDSIKPYYQNVGKMIIDGEEARRRLIIPPAMNGFAWNKLYQLNIIKDHKIWFSDNVGTTEDMHFAFRYLEFCNKVVFDPSQYVYNYFQRPGAATHSKFSIKQVDSLNTYQYIFDNSTDFILQQSAKAEMCNTSLNLLVLYENDRFNNIDIYSYIKKQIRMNIKSFICCDYYNTMRKIQAVMAFCLPKTYAKLKNKLHFN